MIVSWVLRSKEHVCEWTFQAPMFRFSVGQDLDEFFSLVDALSQMVAQVRAHMSDGMDKQAAIEEVERMLRGNPGLSLKMPSKFVGLLLRFGSDSPEMWTSVKQAAVDYIRKQIGDGQPEHVLTVAFPCGNTFVLNRYEDITALEKQDVPCPCGDPSHWFIKCELQK